MARRTLSMVQSLQQGKEDIELLITGNNTGAVTLTHGRGVTSATRSAAGNVTVKLDHVYQSLVGMSYMWGNIGAQGNLRILIDTANSNVANSTGGVIKISCVTTANAAAELPTGSKLFLRISASVRAAGKGV